jgi:hypothetical protein
MTFVPFSKLSKELTEKISMNPEKVDKELSKKPILTEPVIATSTFGEHSELPLTTLSDIFENNNKEEIFRTRFYVIKITPNEVEDFVESYVPKETNG